MSHRDRIKKKMMTWQLAAVAIGAGAVALVFSPLERLLSPPAYIAPKGDGAGPTLVADARASLSQGFLDQAIEGLKKIGGTREVQPVAEVPTLTEDPVSVADTPPPPQTGAGSWVYKGYMSGGGLAQAWIQLPDSSQAMLTKGAERDGTKLKDIFPDHIMVEQAGAEKRIDLAQRVAVWNTEPPQRAPAAARPSPQANAANERQKAAMRGAIAAQAKSGPAPGELSAKYGRELSLMGAEKREAVSRMLTEPGVSLEQREMMLKELGIPLDLPVEDRLELLRQNGVTEESDPRLYEMVKEGRGK